MNSWISSNIPNYRWLRKRGAYQAGLSKQVPQRLALDEFHRVIGPAVGEPPHGMDRHDGWVGQLCSDTGLTEEATDPARIGALRFHHLDGE